jgi:hypothetical protein
MLCLETKGLERGATSRRRATEEWFATCRRARRFRYVFDAGADVSPIQINPGVLHLGISGLLKAAEEVFRTMPGLNRLRIATS